MGSNKRTRANKPHGWAWEWEEGLEDGTEEKDEDEKTDKRGTEDSSSWDEQGKADKK